MLPWPHADGMGKQGNEVGRVGGPKVKEFGGSRVSCLMLGSLVVRSNRLLRLAIFVFSSDPRGRFYEAQNHPFQLKLRADVSTQRENWPSTGMDHGCLNTKF